MTQNYEENGDMKILLQESNYAFTITMQTGGGNNTDYADYTSNNFITGFRHVLQKPDLSRAQLASMLRAAERRRKHRDNDTKWADVMAITISKCANANLQNLN